MKQPKPIKEMTEAELHHTLHVDPRYFIETFLCIIDKSRRDVPFLLNPPQARYYERHEDIYIEDPQRPGVYILNAPINDLILKARKKGFSSLIEALWLHACMFIPNSRAVIMSHEKEATKRHLERVRYYLDTMGGKEMRFKVELEDDNQMQISFPDTNSSLWIGTAGAKAFGRGDDITHLHLSEVAHYEHQDVLTGVLEACVPNAWKVMETTANGMELFYRTWQEAGDPQSGSPWVQYFFAWFEDPTNVLPLPVGTNYRPTSAEARMQKAHGLKVEQLNWWRNKRAGMLDKSKMPQEYPSTPEEAFIFGGRRVFDQERIAEMILAARKTQPAAIGDLEDDGSKISFKANPDGALTIWKMPRDGRFYIIPADCSEGVPDGDWSVAPVIDRMSWEVVALYRGRPSPDAFGKILVDMGYFFNNAVLAPELNNHGWGTVGRIKSEKYPHLLNTKEIWPDQKPYRDGFPMLNDKVKNMVISSLRKNVDDMTMPLHHLVSLQEMQTFIQTDSGALEAQTDCHDDCVTSLAIGAYCLKFLAMEETYAERVQQRLPREFQTTGSARKEVGRRNRAGY